MPLFIGDCGEMPQPQTRSQRNYTWLKLETDSPGFSFPSFVNIGLAKMFILVFHKMLQKNLNFLANPILHISEEREGLSFFVSTRDNQTVLAYPILRGLPGYGAFHANTRIVSVKPGQMSPESFFLLSWLCGWSFIMAGEAKLILLPPPGEGEGENLILSLFLYCQQHCGCIAWSRDGWWMNCNFWLILGDLNRSQNSKEIKPVSLKGKQPRILTGRTDPEAEALVFWPPDANSWLLGKVPDAGKDWRQKENRVSEDEMAGWLHWCNGHELGQIWGDG